jgi:rhodanese-related sulfurtransferase
MQPCARVELVHGNVLSSCPCLNRAHATTGVFLDVREPPEWFGRGMVKGAVPIPRGVIEFTAGDRVPLDSRVVVYCSNGVRAALAGSTLLDLGYEDVLNGGSYEALSDAGIPTQPPVTVDETAQP